MSGANDYAVEVVHVLSDESPTGYVTINKSSYDEKIHGKTLSDDEITPSEPQSDSMLPLNATKGVIVAMARDKFGATLNPKSSLDELVAEFKKLEQAKK